MLITEDRTVDRYAVFGNPVAHSLSPKIHALFARQCRQSIEYSAIEVELDRFQHTCTDFFQHSGRGLSITVPFKEQAYDYVDALTERARRAGAVNTIIYGQGQTTGDNTDGIGLVNDLLHNHSAPIEGKQLLILGAGGAVKGVLAPLLEQQPAALVICNRTLARAEQLAAQFSTGISVSACSYQQLIGQSFDLVINGTSSSLHGELPPLPDKLFNPSAVSYDMMYSSEATLFQLWALEHGAAAAYDGLGMLVEQAAEAFYLWRGQRPETAEVIRQLRHKDG